MTDLRLSCPRCSKRSTHALEIEAGNLLGPLTTLRVRSRRVERETSFVPLSCPSCGLVSFFDAARVLELAAPLADPAEGPI